ncbi:MAG TPA: hypothetical protein VGO13_11885 [Solirubrobacterales bacterium]|nr:hypothetical protein [Solirubrobacterales bacterium]
MTQVVEADVRKFGPLEGGVIATTHRRLLKLLPYRVDEDEIVLTREALPAAQLIESPCCLIDQRNAPHLARLRRPLIAPGKGAPYVDEPPQPIDVTPAQRPQLPEPQAGEGGDLKERPVLGVDGVRGEQLDL